MISPCIKLCKLNEGVCIGCARTIEQIVRWKDMTDEERIQIMLTPYEAGIQEFWHKRKSLLLHTDELSCEYTLRERNEMYERICVIERLGAYPGLVREVWGSYPFPLANDLATREELQAVASTAPDGEVQEWAIQLKYYFPTSIVMQNASKIGTSYGKSLLHIVLEDEGIPLKRLYYLLTGVETDNIGYIVDGTLALCKEDFERKNPDILANGQQIQTYSVEAKFDPNNPLLRYLRD